MRIKKPVLILCVLISSFSFAQSAGFAQSFWDSLALGLEQDIGRNNYESITAQKRVVHLPPDQTEHYNNLFNKLVAQCSRRDELHFSLTVVQDDSVNAFALPGGYVFVNTGLLSYIKNDSELAGVLGHEIAHIDRRHSMQAIYRSVGFSVILGLLLNKGSDRNEQLGQLAAISLSLAQLGYSRDAEYEADRYGVGFMQKAGYNKEDLVNFWQRFLAQNGDTPGALTFLSTHPPTSERIKKIEALP
ncbi:MAG: M48 family metallopeptidase [Bacillota bacterium]